MPEARTIHMPVWLVNTIVGCVLGASTALGISAVRWNINDARVNATIETKLDYIIALQQKQGDIIATHLQKGWHPQMGVRMDSMERWRERMEDQDK